MLNKIAPVWPLRIAFGLMYLYSGIDLIQHPTAWHWALPYWLREIITSGVSLNTYLQAQGMMEVVFALILLAWFLPRRAVWLIALLSVFEFAAILVLAFVPFSEANFLITFRDIGLLGGAFTLLLLVSKHDTDIPPGMPPRGF